MATTSTYERRGDYRRSAVITLAVLLLGALALLALPAVARAIGPWTAVSSSQPGPTLNGMDAVSATDIWAVGQGTDYLAHAQHWNGSSWTVVPVPSVPGSFLSALQDVSAVSATDVWAVGDDNGGTPLIVHWNGAVWSRVPTPALTGFSALWSVSAVSANDVWAVGSTNSGKTLTLRWNGSSWNVVPSPNPSTNKIPYNYLYAVHAVSSQDVWAVGKFARRGKYPETLILRWDGSRWRQIASPNAIGSNGLPAYNELRGVTATGANDAWAVGTVGNQALAMRWNGTAWTIVPAPNVPYRTNFLNDVDAVAPNDVWAVGVSQQVFYFLENQVAYNSSLIEHWDGTAWTIVASPNPIPNATELRSSTVVSPSEIWAAGGLGVTARTAP